MTGFVNESGSRTVQDLAFEEVMRGVLGQGGFVGMDPVLHDRDLVLREINYRANLSLDWDDVAGILDGVVSGWGTMSSYEIVEAFMESYYDAHGDAS